LDIFWTKERMRNIELRTKAALPRMPLEENLLSDTLCGNFIGLSIIILA